jgi:hypothetical protein
MGNPWGRLHTSRTAQPVSPLEEVRQPGHQEIAMLAYSYWEARGRQDGSALEDWLRAERELRRRRPLELA